MSTLAGPDVEAMNAIMLASAEVMGPYVSRSSTSIYRMQIAEGTVVDCKLAGSGGFVRVDNSTFGLTAGHVVANVLARGELVVHAVRDADSPDAIVPPIPAGAPAADGGCDLACFKVRDAILDRLPGSLTLDMFRDYESLDDILFMLGYPEAMSRDVVGGTHSQALPFATQEGRSACAWFDPAVHIAVRYPGLGAVDARGREAWLPDAHGFSGSLLWKTNRMTRGDCWSPEDARVVGVITVWDQATQTLIAVRSHVVRTFLASAIADIQARGGAPYKPVIRDADSSKSAGDGHASRR